MVTRLRWGAVLLLCSASATLLGCRGDELGRVPLGTDPNAAITGEAPYAKGTKKIWLDYDAAWKGGERLPAGTIALELLDKDGKVVAKSECSTNASGTSKVCGTTTDINGAIDEDCEVDLGCAISPPAGEGELKLKATVTFTEAARFTTIKKLGLVMRT